MDITLRSPSFEVTAVRKTKAHFWKDVKVGDVIEFSQRLSWQGSGRSGCHAVDITLVNVSQGIVSSNSMNKLEMNRKGFELKKVTQ